MKNTHKLSSRMAAAFLALMMVVSLFPVSAFAEGDAQPADPAGVVTVQTEPPAGDDNNAPTPAPAQQPTPEPSAEPTAEPTAEPSEEPAPVYATQAELDAAFEAVGESDELEAVTAAVEAYIAVYNRLSPEDQAANAEALAGAQSYLDTLRQAAAAEESGEEFTDPDINLTVLDTGHRISVRFTVLYLDPDLFTGYNYGASESTTFVCQYSSSHSDTAYNNHTIAISDIQAAANRLSINSGFKVVGWTKTSSSNPSIYGFTGGPTACNKGSTIYIVAKKAQTFTLQYDGNNNTGGTVPEEQTYTDTETTHTFTVANGKPTRTGYTFLGWSKDKNATTASYKAGNNIIVDPGTTTLYAVWKSNVEQVTLTYRDRGSLYDQKTYNKGTTVKAIDCDNTNAGYEFKGWDTSSSATTVVYAVGSSITLNSSRTLYAVWQPKDNGAGIKVEKTRVSINGDTSKTTAEPGDTITWDITVTNLSNVAKTVTLTEKLSSAYFVGSNTVNLAPAGQPGDSQTVQVEYTVKGADKGKTITNTVEAETDNPDDDKETATDGGTKVPPDPSVTASYTVQWYDTNGNKLIKEDVTRTGTVGETVTVKDNDKTLSGYTYAGDTHPGTVLYAKLAASGTVLKLYFTQNVVDNGGGITVTKTRTSAATAKPGDTITWNIVVKNNSNVVKTVTVKDTLPGVILEWGGKTSATGSIEVVVPAGKEVTVAASYLVKETDKDTIINTVTASTGDPGNKEDDEDSDEPGTTVDDGKGISVVKTRTSAATAKPGDTITWNITVTNLSNVEKTVNLADRLPGVTLSADSVVLAAGAHETITASYEVTANDAGKTISNTVVATPADNPDEEEEDTDEGTTVDDGRGISVEKTRTSAATAKPGDTITWNITVTNLSNVEKTVNLADRLPGVTLSADSVVLAAGAHETITASYEVTANDAGKTISNTVVATPADNPEEAEEDTDEGTTVDNGNGISVTKTRTSADTVDVGDTITWNIVVTNSADVEKTVDIDDQLADVTLTLNGTPVAGPVAVGANQSITVLASYKVKDTDKGTITNTVVVTNTTDPTDKDTDKDDGTEVGHPVTFVYQDGATPNRVITVKDGDSVGGQKPADPTRSGYTFDGWFTAATGGTRLDETAPVTGPVTYYAHWTQNPVQTPTPTPPPEDPDDPDDPDPVPTPGPTAVPVIPPAVVPVVPAGPVVPVVPAADPEVELPEEELPLAGPAATPEPTATPAPVAEDLGDDETPLAGPGRSAWALVNLILMVLTVLASILLLIGFMGKKQKELKDDNGNLVTDAEGNPVYEWTKKRHGGVRTFSLVPAIVALVAFILTEDMRLPMILVDRWTLLMLLIAVVQLVVCFFARKSKDEPDEDNNPGGPAPARA